MAFTYGKTLIKVALADDHTMLRESLSRVINEWEQAKVVIQASNGKELIQQLDFADMPDIALIDLNMPVMNGYDTIRHLKSKYQKLNIIVLSMHEGEEMIWHLIQLGVQGYIHKSADSSQLRKALHDIMYTGYHFADRSAARLLSRSIFNDNNGIKNSLSEKQLSFLREVITEKTYKEIARDMRIPLRQVEYLRNSMFEQFNVQSRTSLAVQILKKGLAGY